MTHPTSHATHGTSVASPTSGAQPTRASGNCDGCAPVALERTRFFARQLVGPDDLTQDQLYFREKHRRHNRLLHGWGIVCGARVRQASPCEVIVEQGYLLGPWGDEIVIPAEVTVDVCHEDLDGNALSPCGAPDDPWCSDVRVDRGPNARVYLAVRYAECRTRPVRAAPCGCGCDETACEHSRIRDSFAIKVLRELPSTYPAAMTAPDFETTVLGCDPRPCPPCPPEPWVILADIVLDAGGEIAEIDCPAHRRYVASFANYFVFCPPAAVPSFRVERIRIFGVGTGGVDPVVYDSAGGSPYPPTLAPAHGRHKVEFTFSDEPDMTRLQKGGIEVRRSANTDPATATGFTVVPGTVNSLQPRIVLWMPNAPLSKGTYEITLRGEGDTAIRSVDGAVLDPELQPAGTPYYSDANFPSGDGQAGGIGKFAMVHSGSIPTPAPTVDLASISLDPATMIAHTANATGTLTLTANAPSGGLAIQLSCDQAGVTMPASVTVPAGSSTATFTVAIDWTTVIGGSTTSGSKTARVTARSPAGTQRSDTIDLVWIG